jgi:uncharacterized membrane protein YjjB (DUF3815 family)
MDGLGLLHHIICGGLAAAGFGVLFNISFRVLPWCFASGALALAVRTVALGRDLNLAGASFLAALTLGMVVQLLPSRVGVSSSALAVVGCIPMIPGALAAKALLGFFAVTAQHSPASIEILATAVENALRVMFTIGALGTGMALPTLFLRGHGRKQPRAG